MKVVSRTAAKIVPKPLGSGDGSLKQGSKTIRAIYAQHLDAIRSEQKNHYFHIVINFKHLDHVLICVPLGKKEEAREFYTNTLCLKEIPGDHPKGAIWFNMGDIQLHLREEDVGNYSERHIAFEISNLEESKQYLQSKGLKLAYSSDISGRKRFFFRDPFDNRIELLEFEKSVNDTV